MMMWQVKPLVHVGDGWDGKEDADDDGAEYEAVLFGGEAVGFCEGVGEGGEEGEEDAEAGGDVSMRAMRWMGRNLLEGCVN